MLSNVAYLCLKHPVARLKADLSISSEAAGTFSHKYSHLHIACCKRLHNLSFQLIRICCACRQSQKQRPLHHLRPISCKSSCLFACLYISKYPERQICMMRLHQQLLLLIQASMLLVDLTHSHYTCITLTACATMPALQPNQFKRMLL